MQHTFIRHNVRTLHPNILIGLHFSFSLNRQFRHFFTPPCGVKSFIGLALKQLPEQALSFSVVTSPKWDSLAIERFHPHNIILFVMRVVFFAIAFYENPQ